ncbi:ATP-binding protein, partial [Kribbella sp. NPDC054772]
SLASLPPNKQWPPASVVGGYWPRTNVVEIAGVGADHGPVAKELLFLGSIKWLEKSRFDDHDLVALQRHRSRLTDDPVPLVAVSRSGVTATGLDAVYGPAELLAAWE